jgi:hypothetical protein
VCSIIYSNVLALLPDRLPRSRLIGPKLGLMEKRIAELDIVVEKLVSACSCAIQLEY